MTALGSAAEAAGFGDGTNVTKLIKFHSEYLCSEWELCIGAIYLYDATLLLSRQNADI
ncbi:hypothetical protein GCM10011585_16960 [Edaphobacter dinghuensis]|uniref:Uncharacterized protein n=1 Tax=Edaphobacter dinghuensis TaxID=1560005 RepID=A0A917M3E4_9BACT|nr:hypothetical protein GCM10011585_16960 [Edaphobacter dinghuensis]